ncbi:aspartate kinase [Macrococcus brunensis]|uniref:Aspartokinase n=1 Tax=Macrococcus brunensis TaxID=198483 RepID=A0A4R6BBW7_9STAP|nr:aspartate kinase [Macrococcus brunensis]TDL95319.1 aspartate kinase [Macrococcus brunensis]
MKISKFGGSSVSDAQQIKKILKIVNDDPNRKVIIVSAPGKRNENDIKVTDLLIQIYHAVISGADYSSQIEAVVKRFEDIEQELNVKQSLSNEIRHELTRLISSLHSRPLYLLDALKSCGENFNAKLIAQYNNEQGIPTRYMSPREIGLTVSDEPGNAMILPESYHRIRERLSGYQEKIVVPGFFGVSSTQDIITFSRGGSDLTGAIIAKALHAELYENFTDVSGIYSANPNIIHEPRKIDELTYDEMRELSYAGFKVFHDEAVAPLINTAIPVVIKNTNEPDAAGTRIVSTHALTGVVGVSCDTGFTSINMKKYLMNREIGFTRKLLTILEEMQISYDHMPSGIDNISIVLRSHQLSGKLTTLISRIQHELSVDEISVEENLAILMIVGEGMKTAIGTANKATSSLSSHQVNLKMINQGSSEISMMFGIDAGQAETAVRAVYQAFFQ